MGVALLLVGGCLPPGGDPQDSPGPSPDARLDVCVRNDGRLNATVRLFRNGDPVGVPVQVDGFTRRCRSMALRELRGVLDLRVDPVGRSGGRFPESLRDVLVGSDVVGLEIHLVPEGVEPFAQSSYRLVRD